MQWFIACAPIWPIVWLLGFATTGRLKLGFWPSYSHPDPSHLHLLPLDVAILPLCLVAIIAPPVALGLALVADAYYDGPLFVGFVLWMAFDPGGFFEWWLD